MPYSLRQARNELGGRIVENLEEEDIEILFEDAIPATTRMVGKIPTQQWFYDEAFLKANRATMEKARSELIHLIREWMSFNGKVEWP